MKILIITQKVDKDDPILGFFHRWIEEFAKHYEKITVICLQKGEYNLPQNVKVLSLGKEEYSRHSHVIRRLVSLYRFYKYIWQERKNYDDVFVHMNQEYVLLGWKFWKLWGKKIYLWRNHPSGGFLTRIAVLVSNKVFCTSPQSFTARFKKTKIMPVGIDTELFKPNPAVAKKPRSILALGRISPIKHLDTLINLLLELQKQGETFIATIVGSPISNLDQQYEVKLHKLAKPLTDVHILNFCPAVSHNQTPAIYQAHEIYVNLTPVGSMDKTIFEAMACGTMVVTSNQSLIGILPDIFLVPPNEPGQLADLLARSFKLLPTDKQNYAQTNHLLVESKHSLFYLINSLSKLI